MLEHYRRVLALRRAHPVLRTGTMTGLRAQGEVVSFLRESKGETLFCAVNLGDSPATIDAPVGNWRTIGDDLGGAAASGTRITLGAWQVCLAVRA